MRRIVIRARYVGGSYTVSIHIVCRVGHFSCRISHRAQDLFRGSAVRYRPEEVSRKPVYGLGQPVGYYRHV